MTTDTPVLIAEIDAALSKASDTHRLKILRGVADLFVGGAEVFSESHVAIFDDVIGRLIEKTELPALIELSARLAPIDNAPANVIGRLAHHDDIAVAGPVLEKSHVLTDDVLAEIAGAKGPRHLAAIAGRAQIVQTVTDILVERGNSEVARKAISNLGASFSELGFVRLIGRAKTDKPLAASISSRIDMPTELGPFLKLTLA